MELKNSIRWSLIAIALLLAMPLYGQRRYYTQEDINEIITAADTVIYRYGDQYTHGVQRALSFENRDVEIDWGVESVARRNLCTVRSNLLYDAVTLINIGAEIPIGHTYSVSVEWLFPWWLSDSRQRCVELIMGTLEARYWFGDRSKREILTGWMCGLYCGGGYYDLENKGVGYQGELSFMGGVTGGYSHLIGERLRMEYSIGVGVISTQYRKYEAQECGYGWNLLLTRRGRYNWFGPTRVGVTLSYMLQRADKRGGAQ